MGVEDFLLLARPPADQLTELRRRIEATSGGDFSARG
jgi:hypothetical protein